MNNFNKDFAKLLEKYRVGEGYIPIINENERLAEKLNCLFGNYSKVISSFEIIETSAFLMYAYIFDGELILDFVEYI